MTKQNVADAMTNIQTTKYKNIAAVEEAQEAHNVETTSIQR